MTSDSTKDQNERLTKRQVLQNPILKKSHVHEKSEKAKRKQTKDKLKKGDYDD